MHLFASLKDSKAEGTGIYFGKDPRTLFVNVQHSATGNDKTMAIVSRKTGDDKRHNEREDDDHENHDREEKDGHKEKDEDRNN